MISKPHSPSIQIQPLEDGTFRAASPSNPDLYADGPTPQDAQNRLIELLEERSEVMGPVPPIEPLDLDPNAPLEPEDI